MHDNPTAAHHQTVRTIADAVERWQEHLRGVTPDGLDELLAEDVTLYSPIMFTPQHGKMFTKAYIAAAAATLGATASSNGRCNRPQHAATDRLLVVLKSHHGHNTHPGLSHRPPRL